jgi:hypothetical protein
MKIFKSLTAVAGLVAIVMTLQGNGCFGGNDVVGVNGGGGGALTGQAYCARVTTTYGPNWFCPNTQANLNLDPNMPKGYLGYCMVGGESLGTVGYSAYLFKGGAYPVTSYSTAAYYCNQVGWGGLGECGGVVTCGRP